MVLPRLIRLGVAFLPVFTFFIFRDPIPPKLSSDERVLFLAAHPDDECLFFSPTLLALSAQTDKLFSLTVSNGDLPSLSSALVPSLTTILTVYKATTMALVVAGSQNCARVLPS